ncbi:hypothetical protein LIER_40768 [Lithospermum erythrorhizon]|uniref:Retrovirus-related Pol polyprotein from transposon TNT 1-94 n=1 Tax=Lithospermum erythrorhizon TaxID=34254 RepID=A0AAV3R3E2_LITER
MAEDKTMAVIPHYDGKSAEGKRSIERGHVEPLNTEVLNENQTALLNESTTRDCQVKHYLFQALDRSIFEQILDRSTAKVIWDSLRKNFGGNEKIKKSMRNSLLREFELLEMKKQENIDSYFARVNSVAN